MGVLTKSQQVVKALRECISSSRWAVGDRMPAEDELMVEFGVSRTTVRDALNTLAYEGLVVRKHGSGTYVSKEIAAGSVALVALADGLASPHGGFHRTLLEESSRRVQDAGYRALLAMGQGRTPSEVISSMPIFDTAYRNEIIGVLGEIGMPEVWERLDREGIPHVLLGYGAPIGRYSVVLDYARQTELATRMLNAYGHEDFALMYLDHSDSSSEDAEKDLHEPIVGLCRKAVGDDQNRLLPVQWSPNYENVHSVFRDWWERRDRPSAIYFNDDALCDVALRDVLDLGISVPDDLAIITNTNAEKDFHFPVPITGMEFDPVDVAAAAWDLLNRLIKGFSVEDPVTYIAPNMRKGRSLGESVVYGG